MRNIFICLFLIPCFKNTFSQSRVYLRPTVETSGVLSSHAGKVIRTPYYEYKIDRIGLLGGVELGLMAGYRFNKERTLIETGIRRQGSGSGWSLTFLGYAVDPQNNNHAYSYTFHFGSAGGSIGTKIPVIFSTQIKHWDVHIYKPTPFSVHCNLIVGVNFFNQRTGESGFNFGGRASMLSPTILMHAEPSAYAIRARSTLYEAGLSFDLRKRQREWFTLTLYYMRGFHNLSVEMLDITLTDITTNSVETHHYNSYGQGSAILFEISKKLFFTKIKEQKGNYSAGKN
jgi:hypothetical protein